jgi:hypothetical protein
MTPSLCSKRLKRKNVFFKSLLSTETSFRENEGRAEEMEIESWIIAIRK